MPKLHPHIGLPALSLRHVLSALATLAVLFVVVGSDLSVFSPSELTQRQKIAMAQVHISSLPAVLSERDVARYHEAFILQGAGHLEQADAAASQADDPLLKGVLLGERYLTRGNESNFSEIALWLARYGDHAQAAEIYKLARSRAPADADFLTEPQTPGLLKNFSSGPDRSALGQDKHWDSGLAAFRKHDMATAATHFKALLSKDNGLSPEDRSAAAFWAYRSLSALGNGNEAAQYLQLASDEPPGFYSILARRVMSEHATILSDPQADESKLFLQKSAVRRAIALKAVGQDGLAEKELRALFPASNRQDRNQLIELARMLDLPAAQINMAVTGAYDTRSGEARYPVPHWKPLSGYHVEPALLFAIMRQESGFNPNARSASGAMGVMQLMPATAHAMAQDARLKLSSDPSVSMALGQHYLERLMDISAIGNNLVYLIASYNAGPGSVIAWQKSAHYSEDPLLFIESIPAGQTRDYIVRVMGNYWVYSEMLGGSENTSVTALSQNRWPHYEREGKQVVAMVSHLTAEVADSRSLPSSGAE